LMNEHSMKSLGASDLGMVVSDSGPLIVLAKLNVLYLLKVLYRRVYVPASVYDEAVAEGLRRGYSDSRTIQVFMRQAGWEPIEEINLKDAPISLQQAHLDRGEKDTLALALSLGNALVLMDDSTGRHVARSLGLSVRGSLGILVEAYRQEIIGADQLSLYFEILTARDDVWISRSLIERLSREILGV